MRDRNQVYQQVFGNILVLANWPILDPKMTHPHKSGSIVKKNFKFATVKLVNG